MLPLVIHADHDFYGNGYWVFLLVGEWEDGSDRVDGAWWIPA